MKKLLVVDNSPVERERLVQSLAADPRFEIVGQLSGSKDLLGKLAELRPDLILFDIDSPRSGGVGAVEQMMANYPLPIVALSARKTLDSSKLFLDAGALSVQLKPSLSAAGRAEEMDALKTTICLMSEVKVVTRRPRKRREVRKKPPFSAIKKSGAIVIGASTGGPSVLAELLTGMDNFPVPIFVAQHISKGFVQGLMDWLGDLTSLTLEIAVGGTKPKSGHVYFAADDFQFGFGVESSSGEIILLPRKAREGEICPSVDQLFFQAAKHFGSEATGILLTGMGRDGAQGLRALRDAGALTVVQDEESCSVFGMPGEAVKLKAARFQLPPDQIRTMLNGLSTEKSAS